MAIIDQLGRSILLQAPARRVVSLVPSLTELAIDLGLSLVGLTQWCVHPAGASEQFAIVGGTKTADPAQIIAMQPDLVIANKEENKKETIDQLDAAGVPVYVSDISTPAQLLQCTADLARLGGVDPYPILNDLTGLFASLKPAQANGRALYLIWRKPWMAAGADTWISQMLHLCGYENVVEADRYPQLEAADFQRLKPELIMLSSEPYPFKDKHLAEVQALCPSARIETVDGEAFSWYGSRVLKRADYLQAAARGQFLPLAHL